MEFSTPTLPSHCPLGTTRKVTFLKAVTTQHQHKIQLSGIFRMLADQEK
jgi:hypothetical protein